MFPSVGTKGAGEPVVQPAERTPSVRAVRCYPPNPVPFGPKTFCQVVSLLGLLTLIACSNAPSAWLAYTAAPSSLLAEGAMRYTLSSDPPLPGLPFQTEVTVATVRIRGNLSASPTTYRFILEALGLGAPRVSTQTVEVAAQATSQPGYEPKPTIQAASLTSSPGVEPRGVGRFEAPHLPGLLIVLGDARLQSQSLSRLGVQSLHSLDGGWEVYWADPGAEARTAHALVDARYAHYVLSLASPSVGFGDPYLASVLRRLTEGGRVVAWGGVAGTGAPSYPASSPYVIPVGATDLAGSRAHWGSGFGNNYGAGLGFVAPGTAVPTLDDDAAGQYGNSYGTSAAAPFVSATAAPYLYQGTRLSGSAPADPLQDAQGLRQRRVAQHDWQPETRYSLVDVAKVLDPANPEGY